MAFQQDVFIAIRTGNPPPAGSGTWDDPYDGSTAARFDAVMNGLTAGQCARLLPGEFPTLGHSGASGSTGFAAKGGTRIVGSGIGVTKIKLTGVAASATRYVIGTDFADVSLDNGFELSDLTLNCALADAGAGAKAGAIRLRGRHVFISRVRLREWQRKPPVGAAGRRDHSSGPEGRGTGCGITLV